MATTTTTEKVYHYQAYKPRPFTPEERKDVTVLFGGLTWKHERLIQGAFQNMGLKAEPLPNIARPDLDAGKELIDVGACCPTIFTTGSLVRFMRDKKEKEGKEAAANNYVFITAGACGPCRFGQYHESYTMALDGIGLKDFRLFLLDQTNLDQGGTPGGGLEVNVPFSMGTVWAILIGDLITDLEYRIRPYEVVPGTTDRVVKESIEELYEVFRNRPVQKSKLGAVAFHLLTRYFTKPLKRIKKKFDAIEVDRLRVRTRVKITGEFWLQTHEGEGNYNIKRWLEQEGAEVIPPPVAVWFDYLTNLSLQVAVRNNDEKKAKVLRWTAKIFQWVYNRLRKALGEIPEPLLDQKELEELAKPYYHHEIDGGEGHMLVGKSIWAHKHKHAHMICELTPYSCMPNTMSVGAMANVLGKYPDLLYAPIEIKGDAEVHALSRCQMVLTEAKKRAQKEFDETLAKVGITLEEARKRAPKSAMTPFPHNGVVGLAANTLIEVTK